jgi:A nuclease family of the HNH/ENDO VII superfamily with conserved AHH
LDEASNGVFLPATESSVNLTGAAVHSTLHSNAYYEVVNERLGAATTREEVLIVRDSIRKALLSVGL